MPIAVTEMLSKFHCDGSCRASNSRVDVAPVAVTVIGVLRVTLRRRIGQRQNGCAVPFDGKIVRARALICEPKAQRVLLPGRCLKGLAERPIRANGTQAGGRLAALRLAVVYKHLRRQRNSRPASIR